jgi:hypothetical protein
MKELAQYYINDMQSNERGKLSDGYHTFDELYDHRIRLYLTLCKMLHEYTEHDVWCSDTHSDGSKIDDWVLLGINTNEGEQISYHIPDSYLPEVATFSRYVNKSPKFDEHTSEDVLLRLQKLLI